MEEPDGPNKRNKCSSLGAALCGRTGLLFVMAGYTILGALLFIALEGGEKQQQDRGVPTAGHVQRSREECLKELWIITERLNVLYEKNWTKLVTEQLRRFERSVIDAGQSQGDAESSVPTWTFGGALLYSVTLLTTVGYGRLSPRTAAGKAVAMIYAAIGVPLMLILLSGLGALLAGGAKRGYSKLCCLPQNDKSIRAGYERAPTSPSGKHHCRSPQHEDATSIQLLPTYSSHGHDNYNHHNQFADNHRLPEPKMAVLATVRAAHARGRCRQGLSHQMMVDQMTQRSSDIEDDPEDVDNEQSLHDTPSRIPLIWRPSEPLNEPPLTPSPTPKPPIVPTSIILLFLIAYVCLGAAAFASSSGWSFLDSAYFCFIALSTIGISDKIPQSQELNTQFQLVACCAYLLIGLVFVAMCFTLLQEEISYKCRQFAVSIGLVRH